MSLNLGQPKNEELTDDSTHNYVVKATAGQFLLVEVEQRGIDLSVKLFAPNGEKLQEVNNPDGAEGLESVSLLTEVPGEHRIEISSSRKGVIGDYQVRLAALRTPTAKDHVFIEAEKIEAEANQQFLAIRDSKNWESSKQTIEKYKTALSYWRRLREKNREAETLYRLGMIYAESSESLKALAHYNQTLRIWGAKQNKNGEASTLTKIGDIYYDQNNNTKALQFYYKALALFPENTRKVELLNYIAICHTESGNMQEALDAYNQALSSKALRDDLLRASIQVSRGKAYSLCGAPRVDDYIQAIKIFEEHGKKEDEAYARDFLGGAYWTLGFYQYSAESSKQADAYQEAEQSYKQALILWQQLANRSGEATTNHNLGRLYDSQGKFSEALAKYEAAEKLISPKDKKLKISILNNLGFVNDKLGKKQEALAYHEGSLFLSKQLGNRTREARSHYGIALIERANGKLRSALSNIKKTASIVESLRSDLSSPEMRASYRLITQQYYEFYIDLLMQLGQKEKALEVRERSIARVLVESLIDAQTNIEKTVKPELLKRKIEIEKRLAGLSEFLRLNRRQIDKRKELAGLIDDLHQVEAEIRQTSKRYDELKKPPTLSVAEIQKIAGNDSVILVYALGEERSYMWAVTQKKILSYTLPKRSEIEALAEPIHKFLSRTDARSDGDRRLIPQSILSTETNVETLEKLSQMILGDVAPHLGNKKLVIVADGALHYVPFGALPDPNSEKPDRGNRQPLIVNNEIVNLPSVSVLSVLRQRLAERKPAPIDRCMIAFPAYSASEILLANRNQQSQKTDSPTIEEINNKRIIRKLVQTDAPTEKIMPLPYTCSEADFIMALPPASKGLKATVFDANLALVKSGRLSLCNFLHFAVHGLADAEHPELSALILSLVDSLGNSQPGFLHAYEVYNLNLPAELVVLSACQTGYGKQVTGEGLLSLTRGFMYAGASRVVVSLWNVDDPATANLMVRFYRKMLKDGQAPAAALRAAQIEMWRTKEWNSPYFWAAFTLQGEWK